jgi:hypothetical protein
LTDVLREHTTWLRLSGEGGSRLNLVDEDLSWLVAPRIELAECRLIRVKLRNAVIPGSDLRCGWLEGVDLFGSDLSCSALSTAQFFKCKLESSLLTSARVDGAVFARCSGLYGIRRAPTDRLERPEEALASKERPIWADESAAAGVVPLAYGATSQWTTKLRSGSFAQRMKAAVNAGTAALELATSWDSLRSIGGLLVAGSTTLSVAAIVLYGRFREWYNNVLSPLHTSQNLVGQPELTSDQIDIISIMESMRETLKTASLTSLPYPLPMPTELLLLLLAFGLTALGSLLFFLRCPRLVKENSAVRWCREFKLPRLEYESANYSYPKMRLLIAALYAVGGAYLVGYTVFRASQVMLGEHGLRHHICGRALTPRSTSPAPAGVASPVCSSRSIITHRAYAAWIRGQVSSNAIPDPRCARNGSEQAYPQRDRQRPQSALRSHSTGGV